jgi:hypothetical protein
MKINCSFFARKRDEFGISIGCLNQICLFLFLVNQITLSRTRIVENVRFISALLKIARVAIARK